MKLTGSNYGANNILECDLFLNLKLTLFGYSTVSVYVHRLAKITRHQHDVCPSVHIRPIHPVSVPVCPKKFIV